ncbi:MAG: glycosyltransferase family 4 protein [Phycisphaerae bacterium]|jgi:glycosyltransferase involved in cell wall biosynthesis
MKLALFFTFGVSLERWVQQGLFDREKLLYEELLKRRSLSDVFWLTYGSSDKSVAEELKKSGKLSAGIQVLSMPAFFNFPFGKFIYSLLLPIVYKKVLRQTDVLMTNQMSGSWAAVIAKKLYKKTLIIRTGYTLSSFLKKRPGAKLRAAVAGFTEKIAYKNADVAVVASRDDKDYICSTHKIWQQKINVFGNYIDTDTFKPIDCEKYSDRIVFVGRLTSQKNLFNLFDAISKTSFILDIYGQGELHNELEQKAKELNMQVNFMGVVPNKELPMILNHYRYYILPSLYEGTPKTLLEAMACGLVCIGTNAAGINEVVIDGVNGCLAGDIDSNSIFYAIQRAKKTSENSITNSAVETIRTGYSLENVVKKYADLLRSIKNVS